MIFDTHCHLYDEKFNENINEIIKRCFENNVSLIMLVGDNIKNSKTCIKTSLEIEGVFSSIGIHPMEIDSISIEDIEKEIQDNISNKTLSIGEIGLDYYWEKDEDTKKRQKEYFIKQIEIANKLNLPIIVHARDSVEDAIDILKKNPCLKKGVFHCFSGSVEQMKEIVKLGFYIGLDGPVTYKNANTPKQIAKEVPLDRLVIETDSPYLPPVPKRGEINYPYYLNYVIEEIARIREVESKVIEEVTFSNGKKLFNI